MEWKKLQSKRLPKKLQFQRYGMGVAVFQFGLKINYNYIICRNLQKRWHQLAASPSSSRANEEYFQTQNSFTTSSCPLTLFRRMLMVKFKDLNCCPSPNAWIVLYRRISRRHRRQCCLTFSWDMELYRRKTSLITRSSWSYCKWHSRLVFVMYWI